MQPTTYDDHGWQIEWGKLALLGIALVFGFVLVLVALTLDPDDGRFAACLTMGTTTIGTIIGYVTGNGRLAAKGQQTIPAIGRTVPTS